MHWYFNLILVTAIPISLSLLRIYMTSPHKQSITCISKMKNNLRQMQEQYNNYEKNIYHYKLVVFITDKFTTKYIHIFLLHSVLKNSPMKLYDYFIMLNALSEMFSNKVCRFDLLLFNAIIIPLAQIPNTKSPERRTGEAKTSVKLFQSRLLCRSFCLTYLDISNNY